MRLTEEMVLQDNKRFKQCNALAELKYCGWEIPHRKSITNDEIRFYAWLCRSAVGMLKEQKTVEPTFKQDEKGIFVWCCGSCGAYMYHIYDGIDKAKEYAKFCRQCGKAVRWE